MKAKLVIVVLFMVAAGIVVMMAPRRRQDGAPGTQANSAAPPTQAIAQTTIQVVYSTEKREWIEAITGEFAKSHPNIRVELVGKGSIESAGAILDEQLKPTVWSPADSMVLKMLGSDWQTKHHADVFAASGDDMPQPLLLTPLVFVAWEDRARALKKSAHGTISWKGIRQGLTATKGWPAVGGEGRWGFVKLGHTDPTKSNSGLQALYLMLLETTGKSRLAVEDLLNPKNQEFVRGIEKGVTKFESSTGVFMTDMVRFGPSKYDIAVVYESSAISELGNAEGRWGKLKVYYPPTTIWSDHPMALLKAPWVTEAQSAAAREYIAFLHAKPAQQRALDFGFRPADTSVKIVTADAQNPFTRLAGDGITVDVPSAAETPDGPVVRNLMMMWTRLMQP
jgi:ABC-type molybdate transport system substrate-binding protein